MTPQTIAIIWGGAAGMMCAATILESRTGPASDRPHVLLFEKNSRLWAKVLISGGGRCNVTTGTFKRQELLQHYTRWAEFVDYAFRQFGPKKVRQRFEDHGVPLKQEADGRIFPVSDDGADIVGVFEHLFGKYEADIHFKESVQQIEPTPQWGYQLTTNQGSYQVAAIVISTWGEAYAHTGSTGDGYSFARSVGHTITPLGPSLNSFMCSETRIHACTGISFPHARLDIVGQAPTKQSGPVLLTHFGISGPHSFVLASHTAFLEISPQLPLQVLLIPDREINYEQWNKLLVQASTETPKKKLASILAVHFPKRFVEQFLWTLEQLWEKTLSELNKLERKQLAQLLGNGIPLTLIKRRPGDEFVTAGGVATDEVHPETMESLLSPWLYFVGEVLNVDGVTWWYNLQSSWATGRMAGLGITKHMLW